MRNAPDPARSVLISGPAISGGAEEKEEKMEGQEGV